MKQQGFTMLEMVLVMLLIAITSSFVSVHTQYAEEVKFNILVKEVEKGIKSAQYMASITGREYNVYCAEKTVYILLNARKAVYIIDMGKNVSVLRSSTGKYIGFRGGMEPSRGGTIELVNSALSKKARITVRVATGKTTIYFEHL